MRRNALEWAVLLVSVLAIAVVVGALLLEGLSENRPADPRVELHLQQGRQGATAWIIPATVSNAGDEAAEALTIEAVTEIGGATETSSVELDFLPAGTAVDVAFTFSAQPAGEVAVRLVGYRLP